MLACKALSEFIPIHHYVLHYLMKPAFPEISKIAYEGQQTNRASRSPKISHTHSQISTCNAGAARLANAGRGPALLSRRTGSGNRPGLAAPGRHTPLSGGVTKTELLR